jgi:hypothetical protein
VLPNRFMKSLLDVEWFVTIKGGVALVGGSIEDVVVELKVVLVSITWVFILILYRVAMRINQHQHIGVVV